MFGCLFVSKKRAQSQIKDADEDYLMPQTLSTAQRQVSSKISDASTGTRPVLAGPEASMSTISDNIEPGPPVTLKNVRRSMVVMRGPDWKWGEEDGGRNELGDVVAVHEKSKLATVRWRATNKIFGHYRLSGSYDLCMAEGKNGFAIQPMVVTQAPTPKASRGLRDSQGTFSDPAQTVIVLDWDDTLFPTTWIRCAEDLDWRLPLEKQNMGFAARQELGAALEASCSLATSLLRVADAYGHLVIVTLAKRDWVNQSCDFFYRPVGALIKELKIPVVYAREVVEYEVEELKNMDQQDILTFWSEAKGKAIRSKVEKIYSLYEGQTWKNVISIGDSNFERNGTRSLIREYLTDMGINPAKSGGLVKGEEPHIVRVRTKTLKFVDAPNMEELCTELGLLTQWLPLMVSADHGFDIDLDTMEGPPHTWGVEDSLRSGKTTTTAADFRPTHLSMATNSVQEATASDTLKAGDPTASEGLKAPSPSTS